MRPRSRATPLSSGSSWDIGLPSLSSGTRESIDLRYLWYVNREMPDDRANEPSIQGYCVSWKELTSDSYAYSSNVQWSQFVAEDYRRDQDRGDLLRNTSDGHGDDSCPFDDADLLQ